MALWYLFGRFVGFVADHEAVAMGLVFLLG